MKEALIKEKEERQPPSTSTSTSEVRPKPPYSIEFYQERLMQLEMNQFISQQLNPHPLRDSMQVDDDDDDDQEDEEVDQYLNLEDDVSN